MSSQSVKGIPVIIELSGEAAALEVVPADLKGLRMKCRLGLINSIAGVLDPDCVDALAAQPSVYRIYPDKIVYATLHVAGPAVRAGIPHQKGITGKGVTVAVLDTGVHPHPDLTRPVNRLAAFADFVGGKRSPHDDNGHGTHVAGTIAGNGGMSRGMYKGIAPEASIVGVKVLDENGKGQTSTVIQGLEWCLRNRERHGIRIVNLSMGSEPGAPPSDDPLCKAVERLWDSGVIVVVAAGNDGPNQRTVLTPGIDPKVITVGAMDDRRTPDRGDDSVARFSARGPTNEGLAKPDILAPGVGIVSLKVPKGIFGFGGRSQANNYRALSGTSMATAVVAGSIALILASSPDMDPDEVKERLAASAENRGYDANTQGYGYIDVARATAR
ncbi:MAG: S8 family peptidase [Firmicutes bacterium]|jgi:serine protease AprX|nr:S8 family peptidase [Bacillota bacterium]